MNPAHLACILLTPDFCAHGDWRAVAEVLRNAGISIVAARPLRLSAYDVVDLYAGRASHELPEATVLQVWHAHRWDLFKGPARALACIARAPGGCDAALVLSRIKGRSPHGGAGADTLRGTSRRTERYFSLLHVADSGAETLRDIEILLGGVVVEAMSAFEEVAPVDDESIEALLGEGAMACPELGAREALGGALRLLYARAKADPLSRVLLAQDASATRSEDEPLAARLRAALVSPSVVQAASCDQTVRMGEIRPDLGRLKLRAALDALASLNGPAALSQKTIDNAVVLAAFADVPFGRWVEHRLRLMVSFHAGGKDGERPLSGELRAGT